MKIQHFMALVVLSLPTVPGARAAVLAGPLTNAANAHTYYLLSANNWTACEAEARGLGGHLVTINDAAENQWVLNTFFPLIVNSGPDALLWIGLNDAANEGQFVWASGEPVTFTNWYPGEPNNLGGEDYAAIRNPSQAPPTGSWNDTDGLNRAIAQTFGVVELPPPLPVAATQPADQFMPGGSARLNGQANPNGSPTLAWFEWGTSLAYGNVTPPQSVGSGTNAVGFSNVLVGLAIGTEYHFRARASNAFGLAAGLDQTFNLSNQLPVVTSLAVDQQSNTSARLRGQVNPRGWPTAAWFEWGTDTNYGNLIGMQDVGQGSSVSNLNVMLDGLMGGPSYHYRLVATNAFGAMYGADQTFSLGFVPIPIPGLPGVDGGSVAWGDFDNDGRLDFLFTGYVGYGGGGSPYVSQLWRNTGSGFSNVTASVAPGLPGGVGSSVAWGDYDNDGRLDFLLTGYGAGQLWRNNMPVASNAPPAAPNGLFTAVSGNTASLNWNAPADDLTPAAGLNYNLRIGSAPGASDVLAPMALTDGLRLLPALGNAQMGTDAVMNLPFGRYYWSVQAVDTSFAGSPFAVEQQFTIAPRFFGPLLLGNGHFQFSFTNQSGAVYEVLGTTNMSLPVAQWSVLGLPTHLGGGLYQFTDVLAPNHAQRFYLLRQQ